VVIGHAYTERKVVPLDLFLRTREPAAVRAAVLDYGNAIKELAAVNIFPGDILLKNFGVKPDGRVVFYDYDELTLLTEVSFRAMPRTDDVYDEVSGEPWFYVGERDVFPEEFPAFIALPSSTAPPSRPPTGTCSPSASGRGCSSATGGRPHPGAALPHAPATPGGAEERRERPTISAVAE
jgi:hypothetical protein